VAVHPLQQLPLRLMLPLSQPHQPLLLKQPRALRLNLVTENL
jgi:hypothetical protein